MSKSSTKSDEIADVLAEEIIRGEIAPGERLAQDHIAERFQTSHVPVREALQRLINMELATAEPRRGVRVFSLSRSDHDEILEMRLALEPLALRHAIKNMTSQKLSEITKVQKICDDAMNAADWEKANREFHVAILEPCERPRLLRQIEQLQRLSAHRFHSRWRTTWVKTSNSDHDAIVQALHRKDIDKACIILQRHIVR